MEPENHMFEKENHLPNLHFLGSMLVFAGSNYSILQLSTTATPEHSQLNFTKDPGECDRTKAQVTGSMVFGTQEQGHVPRRCNKKTSWIRW